MQHKDDYDVDGLMNRLEQLTRDWLQSRGITDPVMVGIHTSGVWVAQQLHQRLGLQEELGEVSVTFYRDDFSQVGLHPQSKPSRMPVNIHNRHVLLVDDIVYTGRTLRGAMNELFDFGRPASITAIVMVARGGRELPIEPQIAALHEEPGQGYLFEMSGPEPLHLRVEARS